MSDIPSDPQSLSPFARLLVRLKNFLMLGPLVILLVIIPNLASAATYYVDATSGNDSNNGNSITSPWKTIALLNTKTFLPGDTILFKSGSVWREQLNVTSSGTPNAYITLGAYGTSLAKPIISGSDVVNPSSWQSYKDNIYVANVPGLGVPTQLFVDGTFNDLAHYPQRGFLMTTADATNTTTVIDANLGLTQDQVVGATLAAKSASWAITAVPISAYNNATQTLTTSSPIRYVMKTGWGFYLQNKLWMLTSPGEWYYDSPTGNLYLWTATGDSPAHHTVEISHRAYGITDYGKSYIVLNGLAITGANTDNIYLSSGAHDLVVKNLDLTYGLTGLAATANSYNLTLENNTVKNALQIGITVGWAGNTNIKILNNTVNNAGNVGSMPENTQGSILLGNLTSSLIANNTITYSGYSGIVLYSQNTTVQNNTIDHSCLVLDDCGGIYVAPPEPNTPAPAQLNNSIVGNLVTNSIGTMSGSTWKQTQTRGIYLDNYSYTYLVQGNVVENTDYDYMIHDGYSNTLIGNKGFASRINSMFTQEDGPSAGYVHDNVVVGNVFENATSNPPVYDLNAIAPETNFGTYNDNLYCHPGSVAVVRRSIPGQGQNFNLAAWQEASGQDLQSSDKATACPNAALPSITPSITFSSASSTVTTGGTTTLTWSTTLASSCTASNGWVGSEPLTGSFTTPALPKTTSYTLACEGLGGATTKTITITVAPPPAPTLVFSATQTGAATTLSSSLSGAINTTTAPLLTWSSTNTTSCSSSGGWQGTKVVSGSETVPMPASTTTYTLTCTGSGGTVSKSATISAVLSPQGTQSSVRMQEAINDMSLPNEVIPAGVANSVGWKYAASVIMGTNPYCSAIPNWWKGTCYPDWHAMVPWFVIYAGEPSNPAKNVKVEVDGIELWVLLQSTKQWVHIEAAPAPTWAALYATNAVNLVSSANPAIPRSDGGVDFVPVSNAMIHGGLGQVAVPWTISGADVRAIYASVKHRLNVKDPTLPDDRATANLGLEVGVDYYPFIGAKVSDLNASYVPGAGDGRFRKVTSNWGYSSILLRRPDVTNEELLASAPTNFLY